MVLNFDNETSSVGGDMVDLVSTTPSSSKDSRDEDLAVIEIIVQVFIMVCALAGNSFVLIALWRQRQIRPLSRVYSLMAHLSAADLLVALLNVLPQLIWDITYRFQGGDELCRAVKYFQVFVLYLSTFLIVAMALDRYLAVTRPSFGHRNDQFSIVNLLVVSAWILAALFAIPQPFIFRLQPVQPDSPVTDCWATFLQPYGAEAYVLWFVVTIFALPVCVISYCYGTICGVIWQYDRRIRSRKKKQAKNASVQLNTLSASVDKDKVTSTDSNKDDSHTSRTGDSLAIVITQQKGATLNSAVPGGKQKLTAPLSKAKMKTIRLTLTVVICFFFCWSPFCFAQVCFVFKPPPPGQNIGAIHTILLLLASLNSCTNPWIYLMFSGSLLNQLRNCCGLGVRRARPGDEASVGDEEPAPLSDHQDKRAKKGKQSEDVSSTGHTDCT